MDRATTAGKDTTGSVADRVKDNVPETGKGYTTGLADIVNGVANKAADLNKSYQDQATDGTKEGRQGAVGLAKGVGDSVTGYLGGGNGK
jgi:hypothetical protein